MTGALAGVRWDNDQLIIIDQTALPVTVTELTLDTLDAVVQAIKSLAVRGAPAIAIAASYGLAQHCLQQAALLDSATSGADLAPHWQHAAEALRNSRPTAVNIFHAMNRMRDCAENHEDLLTARELAMRLLMEARRIHAEDANLCDAIARHGQELLPENGQIMTICNTGALASGGVGTALGCIRAAHEAGRNIRVLALETRPLLQGARLTAPECERAGIPVRLCSDGMAGHLMAHDGVDAVIVGADRIAANGDTANKVGTYQLAVLAKHHGIPFYVAAPSTTFDLSLKSGSDIPIEERDAAEIHSPRDAVFAPPSIAVCNPAFDVTPAALISGIICEHGVTEASKEPIAQLVGGEDIREVI